jgi:hypothetical protein
MAISAARSDLTIAVTGTDETTAMLSNARDQVASLEAKLRSLKVAGDQQATSANRQTSALGNANRAMTGFAKGAESVVEGLDKTKGAFGKVVGALGFWGAAVSGAIALGAELVDALGLMTREVDAQTRSYNELVTSAQVYTSQLREIKKAADDAGVAAAKSVTEIARLNVELAKKSGDKAAVSVAENALALEEAADRRLEASKQFFEADKELATAQAQAAAIAEKRQKVEQAIANRDASIRDQVKRNVDTYRTDVLRAQKLVLQQEAEDLEDAERNANRLVESMSTRVEGLEDILDRLGAIESTPDAPKADDKDPKPRGSPGPAKESDSERRQRIMRQEREELQRQIRANREFTAQVIENSRLREEREKAEAKFAAEAAEKQAEFQEARERFARMDAAGPVMDLANALSQHLGPALSFVEQAMQQVTDIFQSFVDGQTSLADAVAGSAHAIARAVAEQIGGVKTLAAVDAAYHLFKGFGTMSSNPVESAGHFIAAAGLGLVAAGVIPTGTAGAKKPDQRGIGRREESQASDTGERTVVYNISAGVMDGQSVSRAVRQSERSSRGTGYSARGV